ncbi:hypothetical protein [Lysobacter firmicutimachus]|uniref:Uncharacterized protein n=1 Tax=Lysobacter firmicutimachus TaxID=1792846 RepID=A0ABU8D0R0_9GAMM
MTNHLTKPDHASGAFFAHRYPVTKGAQIDFSDPTVTGQRAR